MACGVETFYMHTIILTILLLLISNMKTLVVSEPQVPCYFIFGDSLFDDGNNNLLITMAKSNYPPYGIDFPDGPTGRFTNGRTTADLIGELLGFDKYIPPFVTAKGDEIMRGVNYASSGAGIRDETSLHQGQVISLNKQLLNHQTTILQLTVLLGSESAAKDYLSKCLYLVGMGNNDYLNNYLLPQYYPTSSQYSPDQFAAVLIQQYSKQLKTLCNVGARKVAVIGLGPIGYIPLFANGSADAEYINNLVQQFDDKLKTLVDDHNNNLSDAKFIYINTTSISSGDPSSAGITVVDAPCCKVSTIGQCVPGQGPCSNRAEHAFYDAMHPSEISNQIKASRAYSALLPTDAYPFDISHLVQYFNSGIKEALNDIIDFDRQAG